MPRVRRSSLRPLALRSLVLVLSASLVLVATKHRFASLFVPTELRQAQSLLWVTAHRAHRFPLSLVQLRPCSARLTRLLPLSLLACPTSRRRVLLLRTEHPQLARTAPHCRGGAALPICRCGPSTLLSPSRSLSPAHSLGPAAGNHEGLGETRRQELGESCRALGIRRERCTALDLPCVASCLGPVSSVPAHLLHLQNASRRPDGVVGG